MRLRAYLGGRRVSLTTPLPPEEVEIRINARTVPPFNLFRRGVLGAVSRSGRVALHYRGGNPVPGYMKLALTGRIRSEGSSARLDLVYRAPPIMFALFALFWLAVPALLLRDVLLDPGPYHMRDGLSLLLILPACALLPLVLYYLTTIRAASDLEEIVSFLAREIEASRVPVANARGSQ